MAVGGAGPEGHGDHAARFRDRFWLSLALVDGDATRVVSAAALAVGDVVLVIACPHALGLAIPLVIAISTALAARAGILVKDRLALERMRTVDAVLMSLSTIVVALNAQLLRVDLRPPG